MLLPAGLFGGRAVGGGLVSITRRGLAGMGSSIQETIDALFALFLFLLFYFLDIEFHALSLHPTMAELSAKEQPHQPSAPTSEKRGVGPHPPAMT